MRVKKTIILGVGLLALAACDQQVPNSGQGVGFNDYAQYEIERAQREAALRGGPATAANTPILPPAVGVSTAELAAAGINTGGDTATADTPDGSAVVAAAPIGSNPDISDEQNFAAVASRESIESDAERRARQAAAYQLIEVTDLPDRSGNTGPNIVQYALQAPNDRGEPVFTRTGLSGEARFQRNCAAYRSPDDAQRDFLSRGGPQRDRLGLDPDGDGFACGWDPQAFRALAGN
jgi:hypothetical protein